MLQKMTLQQLQSSGINELKVCYVEATKRKSELEALKKNGSKAWNSTLQDELDDVTLYIVDIEDAMEEKEAANSTENEYVVKPGTEKSVHLKLVKGRRFNSMTGKEESKPFVQIFNFAEWQLFKKHFQGLGYAIISVLHDPYNEAEKFVSKN